VQKRDVRGCVVPLLKGQEVIGGVSRRSGVWGSHKMVQSRVVWPCA